MQNVLIYSANEENVHCVDEVSALYLISFCYKCKHLCSGSMVEIDDVNDGVSTWWINSDISSLSHPYVTQLVVDYFTD